MTTREVVSGILLSRYELLRMEQLTVHARRTSSITVGSRSRKTARGTCFPAPVSEKNVLKASSPPPVVLSLGICPSGCIQGRKEKTQPSDKTPKKRKGYKEPETRETSKRLTSKIRRRTRNNFEENHRKEAY